MQTFRQIFWNIAEDFKWSVIHLGIIFFLLKYFPLRNSKQIKIRLTLGGVEVEEGEEEPVIPISSATFLYFHSPKVALRHSKALTGLRRGVIIICLKEVTLADFKSQTKDFKQLLCVCGDHETFYDPIQSQEFKKTLWNRVFRAV